MPKIKKARVGIKIDMTPMVDVAFLLLTFFMLTTQFKPPEDVTVELPSSHSDFKLPESDVMTITLNKEGKIYLGVDSQQLRMRLFGDQFGEEAKYKISVEVSREDLPNLLIQARIANPRLRTVVRGDRAAPYGPMEDVMNVLQKTKITRFNLVTDLERT
ncbi:MAG: biopolymer transporter ExbD [candidate division KSB1 bacterium]|nr:biopolymer transporter ExbD [candidate division KSB1 bacterium]MDZ7304552.1 biopolymer transporter ExbD [candidate division KSB1 bacterium]MDZ7313721.1 biopolymer transporter ExbD [candidate division KSB1 bacterium]